MDKDIFPFASCSHNLFTKQIRVLSLVGERGKCKCLCGGGLIIGVRNDMAIWMATWMAIINRKFSIWILHLLVGINFLLQQLYSEFCDNQFCTLFQLQQLLLQFIHNFNSLPDLCGSHIYRISTHTSKQHYLQ